LEVCSVEEHLQRLRNTLTQAGLTALDARDGMVSAYVVISRLNQLKGNPDVGLKQDEKGLNQHIVGFMGAVFWERGFNFDHPTVPQLAEIKMMLDGMVQIYAMPEKLQMALNEICDYLLAKAANQPAILSPAVMEMLEYTGDKGVKIPETGKAFPEVVAQPEPDLDREPETAPEAFTLFERPAASARPVPEPKPAPESEPEFAPASESKEAPYYMVSGERQPNEEFQPKIKPEPETAIPAQAASGYDTYSSNSIDAPEVVADASASAKDRQDSILERLNADTLEVRSDRPDEPGSEFESLATSAPETAAAKKRRARKKSAPFEPDAPVETQPASKPPRKRARTQKSSVDVSKIVVPEDYMSGQEVLDQAEPQTATVTWAGFSEPAAEPAREPETQPLAEERFNDLGFAAEPNPQPLAEAQPESASSARQGLKIVLDHEAGSAEERPFGQGRGAAFFWGCLLGLLLAGGGLLAVYYLKIRPEFMQTQQALEKRVEALHSEASKLNAENDKMKVVVDEIDNAWRKPPAKILCFKAGTGVAVYWPDTLLRKYYLYQAKGVKANLVKVGKEPLERNVVFFPRLSSGLWRFAVTAVDKAGKETDKSQALTVTLPLWK
jgi:hypothetical protein